MTNSDDAKTKEKTGNQKENLTLSQKVEKLIETKSIQESKPIELKIEKEFCIICKLRRLDPDPTGLTCNSSKCLAELGKLFEEIKEKIEKSIESLGLKIEKVSRFFNFGEQNLETVREKIDAIASELNIIAETLGFDQVNRPDELTELCEMIKDEVTTLQEAIKRLEKKQKTD